MSVFHRVPLEAILIKFTASTMFLCNRFTLNSLQIGTAKNINLDDFEMRITNP